MALRFEALVAYRYFRARRQEGVVSVISAFSLLGIMLGVATLIIVMSVMNGFRHELLSRIIGINGHMRLYEVHARPIDHYAELRTKVLAVAGIVAAHPIIERQAMATVPGGAAGVVIHGMEWKDLAERSLIRENIKWGSLEEPLSDSEILIGKRLAEKLNLQPGGAISLIIPNGLPTAFGNAPRMKTFIVRGIFEIGMIDYDSAFVFIPLQSAQAFFRLGDTVTNIEVFTKDPTKLNDIIPPLLAACGPEIGLLDWQKANAGFFEAVQVERNVMFIILTLIILVAAFNIISSLTMLVKDKTADIAILRTLGASRGMIMRVFLLVGGFIGFMGTMAGFILGVSFAHNIEGIRRWFESLTDSNLFQAEIYFLTKLPAIVDPEEVALVVGIAFFLSFGATFYPAWRAARLDPVEALRQA